MGGGAVYLAILGGEGLALADKAYRSASNMTDQVGALAAICQTQGPAREAALEAFYEQWKGDSLVGGGGCSWAGGRGWI